MKKCPFCSEEINDEAIICGNCGRAIYYTQSISSPKINKAEGIAPIHPNNKTKKYKKKCPYCAEEIQGEAIVCRYCNRDLLNTGPISPSKNTKGELTKEPSAGAKALAGISVTCGIIGLLVFGIPLGIVAIACGIPALAGGASGGKAGIVLGIIDIVLAICILMVL